MALISGIVGQAAMTAVNKYVVPKASAAVLAKLSPLIAKTTSGVAGAATKTKLGSYVVSELGEETTEYIVQKAVDRVQEVAEKRIRNYTEQQTRELAQKGVRGATTELNSLANKRLKRLEEAGLTDTPAYRNWAEFKGERFSTTGDEAYEELLRKYHEVERFRKHKTSTVRGATEELQRTARALGLNADDRVDIQQKSGKIFFIKDKVAQLLKATGEYDAVGTDELLEYITDFVQRPDIDFDGLGIDDIVEMLSDEDVYGTIKTKAIEYVKDEAIDKLGDWIDFL